MNPAELDRSIEIVRKTNERDENNEIIGNEVTVFTGRAKIIALSSSATREENRTDRREYLDTRHFTIRMCGGFEPMPTDTIIYNGGRYDIFQIIDLRDITRQAHRGMYWRLTAERRD